MASSRARRSWIAVAAPVAVLVGASAALGWRTPAPKTPAANPVTVENSRPGLRGWLLPAAAEHAADGYASEASVVAGGRLHLHVATAGSARYRVLVVRLGWYRGIGARLLACRPSCTGSEQGTEQPVPSPDPATGKIVAGWPVTDVIRVPRRWTSGYYVAEVELTSGPGAGRSTFVPFVVRARPAARPSRILVVAPVNTWEAYNAWGGKSAYISNVGGGYARELSFNRPYDVKRSRTLLSWEYPLVRFLERRGYDVSYTTDVDVDRAPRELLRHRLVIVPGHSEYWTKGDRDAFEAARDAGANLAFLGGNDVYWQARYSPDRRTIKIYRDGNLEKGVPEQEKSLRFRDLLPPRPECTLLGLEWQGGWNSDGVARSYTVEAAALHNRWFRGTGFKPGSVLNGLVGYEWDAVEPGCMPPHLQVLFHYEGVPTPDPNQDWWTTFTSTNGDVVTYRAPSGARVFAAGSIQFSWGLDGFARRLLDPPAGPVDTLPPDPRLERFMVNVLDDLSGRRAR